MMFYDEDEPSWVTIEISALGITIEGRDGEERTIVYLGGTFHAISKRILKKNGVKLKVGLLVEVEFFDSVIVNMRMPETGKLNYELIAS